MIKRTAVLGFVFAFLSVVGGFAHAQSTTVTYTFSGNANGSVGGANFAAQNFTITVTANAATVLNAGDPQTNVLTGGSIRIAGTACAAGCSISGATGYLVYHTSLGAADVHGISTVGNPNVPGQTLLEGCFNCGGTQVNDNLVTTVPLTVSAAQNALAPYLTFATSGGAVQITLLNSLSYGVAVVANPIPTLSEWGMITLSLLLSFGAWGAMRRRRAFRTAQ